MEGPNKQGLEYLVIPGSSQWESSRIKTAIKELRIRNFDKILITGGYETRETLSDSVRYKTYKAIRETSTLSGDNVKPINFRLANGIDSEEDILYLGNIVKPGDTVYFDTFFLHYLEYKTLVNKAKRDRKFPEGVKLKISPIPQTRKEIIYGVLGLLEEVFKRRPVDYKNTRQKAFLDRLKPKVNGIKNLILK